MGSRNKEAQEKQKAYFERKLEERLSFLAKKGVESPGIEKDVIVKKLRANIRAMNDRLKAIAGNERRTEELARIKAEKAALPKDQAAGKEKPAKGAPEEGKEKKKKKEKEQKPEKEKGKDQEQKPAPEKEQKPEEEKKQDKKEKKEKKKKPEQEQVPEKKG